MFNNGTKNLRRFYGMSKLDIYYLKKVNTIFSDVDGVFTDSSKIYDLNGKVTEKRFSDIDTLGFRLAELFGIKVVLASSDDRINPKFAEAHRVDFIFCGTHKTKCESIKDYMKDSEEDIYPVYIGNDLNDFDCLVGMFSFVPEKSCPLFFKQAVKTACDKAFFLKSEPGNGCFREVVDVLFEAKNITTLQQFYKRNDYWREKPNVS